MKAVRLGLGRLSSAKQTSTCRHGLNPTCCPASFLQRCPSPAQRFLLRSASKELFQGLLISIRHTIRMLLLLPTFPPPNYLCTHSACSACTFCMVSENDVISRSNVRTSTQAKGSRQGTKVKTATPQQRPAVRGRACAAAPPRSLPSQQGTTRLRTEPARPPIQRWPGPPALPACPLLPYSSVLPSLGPPAPRALTGSPAERHGTP